MMMRGIGAGLVLLLSGAVVVSAQPEKPAPKPAEKQPEKSKRGLAVGDKAAEITVKKWVKGEPVTGFEKGKVYVVEFWATWCGPCKESIPHLTELQSKYKDKATVVGVSVWERDDTAVEPFVKQWTGKMEYTVGTDDIPALPEDVRNNTRDAQIYRIQNGRMSQGWLKAAGRDTIPTAFVVNQEGVVAWVGDPRGGLDDALEQVVAGTWDLKKAAARHGAQLDVQGMKALQQAFRDEDWVAALKEIDGAMGKDAYRDVVLAAFKYQILMTRTHDHEKGMAFGREAVAKYFTEEAELLNQVAWYIVDPKAEPKVEKPDLDLALEAAKRAVELTKEKDAGILDTLALVYFVKGDAKKAVELQKKAVEMAPEQIKEELEERLKQFQEAVDKEKDKK